MEWVITYHINRKCGQRAQYTNDSRALELACCAAIFVVAKCAAKQQLA